MELLAGNFTKALLSSILGTDASKEQLEIDPNAASLEEALPQKSKRWRSRRFICARWIKNTLFPKPEPKNAWHELAEGKELVKIQVVVISKEAEAKLAEVAELTRQAAAIAARAKLSAAKALKGCAH